MSKQLKHTKPFQIKSKDDVILYYSLSALISQCQYFNNLITECKDQIDIIELPFKAKQIDAFLTYLDRLADDWFDEQTTGLEMLTFIKYMALIADFLDHSGDFLYIKNILKETYGIPTELIIEYAERHQRMDYDWRLLYDAVRFILKAMKKKHHPFLSMTREEAIEYHWQTFEKPIEDIFSEAEAERDEEMDKAIASGSVADMRLVSLGFINSDELEEKAEKLSDDIIKREYDDLS